MATEESSSFKRGLTLAGRSAGAAPGRRGPGALAASATLFHVGALLSLMLLTLAANAAEFSTAKSDVRGVTVSVTPLIVAPEAKRWSFSIVLDTHTQPLNDDIGQAVTLTAADGRPLKPVSWEGAAPGGHHRVVTVHFAPPSPPPTTVEVRVHRDGEPMARVFRFDRGNPSLRK